MVTFILHLYIHFTNCNITMRCTYTFNAVSFFDFIILEICKHTTRVVLSILIVNFRITMWPMKCYFVIFGFENFAIYLNSKYNLFFKIIFHRLLFIRIKCHTHIYCLYGLIIYSKIKFYIYIIDNKWMCGGYYLCYTFNTNLKIIF